MIPEKLVELKPAEWTSSGRPRRGVPYMLKVLCIAVALSALYNFRSVLHAVQSLSADHEVVPPGSYAWTPEHGLQPLTVDSPVVPPRR